MSTTRTATKRDPARPDDQPFDFNLDAVQAESELTPFVVHWNGQRWTFEHMQALDAWELLAAAEGGDVRAVTGALELALGDQWPEFRKIKLPQYKLMPLFQAWQKHCGLEPGESVASSDS
ncbi:hypothetical protein [Streptomyces sp. NPDC005970]|uniref:hypothetical protein n=1 Tax=Streptomyces sp. NPDC005970 TaxID=3156723 RepID=UPI0033D24082